MVMLGKVPNAVIGGRWKTSHTQLLEKLKDEIKQDSLILRSNFKQNFYLEANWLSEVIGNMLLHSGNN